MNFQLSVLDSIGPSGSVPIYFNYPPSDGGRCIVLSEERPNTGLAVIDVANTRPELSRRIDMTTALLRYLRKKNEWIDFRKAGDLDF